MNDIIDIDICTDCLVAWANADFTGMDEETEARVQAAAGIPDGYTVSPGHHHTLEDCGYDVFNGYTDCPYDEGHFSWTPCDACLSPLGGDRYPASMWPTRDRIEA